MGRHRQLTFGEVERDGWLQTSWRTAQRAGGSQDDIDLTVTALTGTRLPRRAGALFRQLLFVGSQACSLGNRLVERGNQLAEAGNGLGDAVCFPPHGLELCLIVALRLPLLLHQHGQASLGIFQLLRFRFDLPALLSNLVEKVFELLKAPDEILNLRLQLWNRAGQQHGAPNHLQGILAPGHDNRRGIAAHALHGSQELADLGVALLEGFLMLFPLDLESITASLDAAEPRLAVLHAAGCFLELRVEPRPFLLDFRQVALEL